MVGKKKSAVHRFLERIVAVGSKGGLPNKDKYRCKFCTKWTTSLNATRMANHIINCPICPKSIQNDIRSGIAGNGNKNVVNEDTDDDDIDSVLLPATDRQGPSGLGSQRSISSCFASSTSFKSVCATNEDTGAVITPQLIKQNKPHLQSDPRPMDMGRFVDIMSSATQDKLDESFARAIYASGSPLSIASDQYWLDHFKLLRPVWKVPSRYKISKPLLNAEYIRVGKIVDEKLGESTTLAIMLDGWTNVRRESIVNFIVTTPEPIFYKTIYTGAESHTSQYIAKILKEVIVAVGAYKVTGIVADNAANMKSACKIIESDPNYAHISTYGCVAHGLNLLFNDFSNLDTVSKIMSDCSNIVKEIMNAHGLSAVFAEKQSGKKISLKLPVKTRWGSNVDCMQSILFNKAALQGLTIDDRTSKVLKTATKNLLTNDVLWDKLTILLELFLPIKKWIHTIESDKPMISSVCTIFDELATHFVTYLPLAPFSKQEEKQASQFLHKRKDFCLKDVHRAANLLDPKKRGENISEDEAVDAIQYICNLATHLLDVDEAVVLADCAKYQAKEGIWAKPFMWVSAKSTRPDLWWKVFCSSTQLSKVASRILTLPPTSAACERSFSAYGNTHTKKRNRLTTERAGKLVYIRHNLKLLQQEPDLVDDGNESESETESIASGIDEVDDVNNN